MTAESLMKASGKASEEWIEWATAKANWLDPTIRAEDPSWSSQHWRLLSGSSLRRACSSWGLVDSA